MSFKTIVFTGGPCAGKTSAVSILIDLLQSHGYKVYTLPETATLLFSCGVSFPDLDDVASYCMQKSILKTMIQIEDVFRQLAALDAKRGLRPILICDRGAMDPAAYMERKQWLSMLDELGYSEGALRDDRYDVVVHMVTAAKGAAAFYSLDSNATRTEGIEYAKQIDTQTMNAWIGHASLQVIDNESVSNFAEKCDRVVQSISTRLGLTQQQFGIPLLKKKFKISSVGVFPTNVAVREFQVEHIYLINTTGDTQTRIRKRQEVGTSICHFTMTVRDFSRAQRVETRRNMSRSEWDLLKTQSDPLRCPILKTRKCFVYKDHYFQMDTYQSPRKDLILLEGYVEQESKVPDWLTSIDVTDNMDYSMFNLALK